MRLIKKKKKNPQRSKEERASARGQLKGNQSQDVLLMAECSWKRRDRDRDEGTSSSKPQKKMGPTGIWEAAP